MSVRRVPAVLLASYSHMGKSVEPRPFEIALNCAAAFFKRLLVLSALLGAQFQTGFSADVYAIFWLRKVRGVVFPPCFIVTTELSSHQRPRR